MPREGATSVFPIPVGASMFQYMPPRAGQHGSKHLDSSQKSFQYMPPTGGATRRPDEIGIGIKFQYMPHVGGATGDETKNNTVLDVSIHAPHAGGGNQMLRHAPPRPPRFNTCPRGGGQHMGMGRTHVTSQFQYMPPHAGGQHNLIWNEWYRDEFQYMPPMRGATGVCYQQK